MDLLRTSPIWQGEERAGKHANERPSYGGVDGANKRAFCSGHMRGGLMVDWGPRGATTKDAASTRRTYDVEGSKKREFCVRQTTLVMAPTRSGRLSSES